MLMLALLKSISPASRGSCSTFLANWSPCRACPLYDPTSRLESEVSWVELERQQRQKFGVTVQLAVASSL